jgi:hypothetical protein
MTSTAERVPTHTSQDVNRRIRNQTARRVRYYATRPEEITTRLRELDEEWDIERAIEANAAALAFTGVALGSLGHRRWLLLPAAVTAFLFQHAIQGWCPPVPVLRRLGFRTADEINQERAALKALRGDFDRVVSASDKAEAALRAVRIGTAA